MNEPTLAWVYTAEVEIGPRRDLGHAASGHRFIVDILGGQFEGPQISGTVLPGGADRQLHRTDGVKELDALYDMQTHDGAILTVRNRVLIDESAQPARYARSVVRFEAPDGPYGWMNRRVFVGSLQSLRPEREAVRIGVYLLA